MVDDHTHADALDAGRGERLDLAAEHFDIGFLRPQHVRLDLLAGVCGAGDAPCDREQVFLLDLIGCRAHAAVPPTVISRTSSVG